MKKNNMAIIALALLSSTTALAEVSLDIGGYYRGYAAYARQGSTLPGTNKFEYREDSEVHIKGKKEFGSQTFGFHLEEKLNAAVSTNEVHVYFSGGWGRVNIGQEDGAVYLLQVAIPSADSNIDGLRAYINSLNNFGPLTYGTSRIPNGTDRLTYFTPKISGFQAGVSFAPSSAQTGVNTGGMALSAAGAFEDIYDIGMQWKTETDAFDFGISAGITKANGASGIAADNLTELKSSFNLGLGDYSFGVGYLATNNGMPASSSYDIWSAGIAWDQGPYHLGASHLLTRHDAAVVNDAYRTTLGAGYTFAPGMSVRTAIAFGEDVTTLPDNRFTQLTLGTDIQF